MLNSLRMWSLSHSGRRQNGIPRGSQRILRRGARRRALSRHAIESMEQRVLLTGLVGIDFGTGPSPTGWVSQTNAVDRQLADLADESGANTGIDV